MSYPKNAATPKAVTVGSVIQISDGAVQTSGCSVRVNLDDGGWGAGGGTLAYDATSGVVTYAPAQAETNGAVLMIAVYKASCIGCSTTVLMDLQSADNATNIALVLADTGELQTNQSAWATATASDVAGAEVDLTKIHGTALTESVSGYLAAGFKKVFDVATPVFTAESVNQAADNNTILANATYGLAALKTHGDSDWITATSTTVSDKTGFSLVSTGLDLVTAWTTDITGTVSGNSTHGAADVKTAIEAAGSHLTLILEDTGTTIPATITTAQGTLTKLDSMIEVIS